MEKLYTFILVASAPTSQSNPTTSLRNTTTNINANVQILLQREALSNKWSLRELQEQAKVTYVR